MNKLKSLLARVVYETSKRRKEKISYEPVETRFVKKKNIDNQRCNKFCFLPVPLRFYYPGEAEDLFLFFFGIQYNSPVVKH